MEGILAAGIKRLPGKTCLLLTYRTNRSFHYFFRKTDILISNFPLDSLDIPIVYISSIPTKNELNRLTELTFKTFL